MLVRARTRHAVGRTHDLLPLRLRAGNVAVVFRKRLRRNEVAVIANQRQPVVAAFDAIGPIFKPVRRQWIVDAGSDEDLDRAASGLCHDPQSRPADFLDLLPELLRRDSLHARGLVADDDLRTRLAVFNEEELGVELEGDG